VSARRRTIRDERRRRLGQNFLGPELAERFVAEAALRPGELVVEIGPGAGALTRALARRGVDVVAVELDPVWARRLRERARAWGPGAVRVIEQDFLRFPFPKWPFRVVGSVPFGDTTAILRRLLDDPTTPLERVDVIVQWEVACKRAAEPPSTRISLGWVPWWTLRLGRRIPSDGFTPTPGVDAGVLVVTRRGPPLLPAALAASWTDFLHAHWPFDRR
jgi:23S rRNA (adenine-N6)-dimethyltransferase